MNEMDYLGLLRSGATTEELETMLSVHENISSREQIELARMNLIGSLRGQGYIIPRKRGYYKIEGFEEKVQLTPANQWPFEVKSYLNWFEKLRKVTVDDFDAIRSSLQPTFSNLHERCPGYILTYEGASDDLRWVTRDVIVAKRFRDFPRFRIIPLNIDDSVYGIVSQCNTMLSKCSVRPVKLVNSTENFPWQEVKFDSRERRYQALYNLDDLINNLVGRLSKGTRSQVNRNLKELRTGDTFSMGYDIDDARSVIDEWRKGPAGQKQRQLAIGRDYKALEMHDRLITIISYRGVLPVAVEIFDEINDYTVSHLVGKALNYTSQPGGYGSTSLASLINAAKILKSQGYQFINGGAFEGGTKGLVDHKKLLSKDTAPIISTSWTSTLPFYYPEVMRK